MEPYPQLSIAWSFAGSVFIAALVQTKAFTRSDGLPFTHFLLRPAFMYHMVFVGYHVAGGAIHVLNEAGYVLWERGIPRFTYDPALLAQCQRLMLFAHASVTAGMTLVGFRYARPRYRLAADISPFGMLLLSVTMGAAGTIMRAVPSLYSFGDKLGALSAAAILLQLVLSLRTRNYVSLIPGLGLFGVTVAAQALSGWKGAILWTVIALGAWLYPMSPRITSCAVLIFLAFWGLWFYAFASGLRRPLWYEGVPQERAIEIALEQTRGLTLWQRAEGLWEALAMRGSDLTHFEKYVVTVPDSRPYYGLEFFRNSVTALTPRILWPDKPDIERLSMERVYEAGITLEEVTVSAKSNLYQDGYLSGGYLGILLTCLSFGVVAMWISQTCERFFGGYDAGTGLVYLALFATPINLAMNTEFLLGSIAGSAILSIALFIVGRLTGWLVLDQTGRGGRRPPLQQNRSFETGSSRASV